MDDALPAPTEQGKMWAMLSYGSFFFGFPLGVLPLLQRDDPYALKHAKDATAVWLVVFGLTMVLGFLYTVISFVTCGFGALLFPMILLPFPWAMLVAIHGLVIAINGQWDAPLGTFGLGEMMFGNLALKTPDEAPRQIPPPGA